MSATVQTNVKLHGFQVQYEAILLQTWSQVDGLVELHAPWTSFRPTLMGQDVEAPKLEKSELDKVQVVVRKINCSRTWLKIMFVAKELIHTFD